MKPLAALSPAYIAYRKDGTVSFRTRDGREVLFKARRPPTGDKFLAKRSNLTFTGQMLDALTFISTDKGARIFIKNTRRDDGKNTNSEIADYVQKQGRPFLELSEKEVKIVQSSLARSIREEIRKIRRR
jgi:hypothetical protein